MQKVKKVAHTEWFRLKLMFQADRKVAALYVVVVGLYSAIPLLSAWLWKLLVDAFTQIYDSYSIKADVWIYLGLFLTLQIVSSLMMSANNMLTERINRASNCTLNQMVMQKMAEVDMDFLTIRRIRMLYMLRSRVRLIFPVPSPMFFSVYLNWLLCSHAWFSFYPIIGLSESSL